jgi:hypothetical protein
MPGLQRPVNAEQDGSAIMSGSHSGADVERMARRLADELQTRFVELICPVCHVVSGKIAADNLVRQRAFDEHHLHCYVNPFSDSSL